MIFKVLISTLLLLTSIYAKDFKVASYNVENLFDLNYDGTEYKEYIPNKISSWNHKNYVIKLKNISKVINDLNVDIIALQEVESLKALKDLLTYTKKYKYYSFVKNKRSAIGLAILSKYKILETQEIKINTKNKYSRPIQKVNIKIENKQITIYNNHWPSKRAAENERIEYALTLQEYLNQQTKSDYILLGDFNSNYNEFNTFKNDTKLNNTYGNTGINQVLNTSILKRYISKQNISSFEKTVHYNLWLDKQYQDRYSYKYKGQNNTPDNILLSSYLFDNKDVSYVNNSFQVFRPEYLYKHNKIQRWKILGKNRIHAGRGYSDHLPIYAVFSTNEYSNYTISKNNQGSITDISYLYKIENVDKAIILKNVIVIYKNKSNAIIKQLNNRAIYIYKEAKELKLGKMYNLEVSKIKNYHGLKEIVKVNTYKFKKKFTQYKTLYTQANTIDVLDFNSQNEIITNLSGIYKKGYLHYLEKNIKKKIKLYAKNSSLLPKNGQKINIISGHLSFYKSKAQIIIYKESDFSVN